MPSGAQPVARPLPVALAAAALVLGTTVVGRSATHHSFGYFTRDPAAVTGEHVYLGMVSVFGLFGWCVAAVCLAAAGRLATLRGAATRRIPLAVGAIAVAYLLFDDAFQLHDGLYPSLGVSDHVTEPIYVLVTGVLLYRGRRFLEETDWRLLVIAGCFFAVSVTSDVITDNLRLVILEDGAKLCGILTLAAYGAQTLLDEARLSVGLGSLVGRGVRG